MPCVTYFDEQEVEHRKRSLTDADIREALDEVNALPGEHWFVQPVDFKVPRLFRKPQIKTLYYLYAHVSGPEWQVINFAPRDDDGWTINMMIQKRDILNYLTGVMCGWHMAKRAKAG